MRYRTRFIAPLRFPLLVGLLALVTACGGHAPEDIIQAVSPSAPEHAEQEAPLVQVEVATQVPERVDEAVNEPQDFFVTSPEFNQGEPIPIRFTCDGEDISPALVWGGIPEGTVSYALVMDDPDAPGGTWIHWVLFNIPADVSGLSQAIPSTPLQSDGSIHGINSWGRSDYGGPCPPGGTHQYVFKLYALDQVLDVPQGADLNAVTFALQGHILAEAALMGTYSR